MNPTRARYRRDDAFRLLQRLTVGSSIAAFLGVGVFAVVAAQTIPGTAAPAPTTAQTSTSSQSSSSSQSTSNSQSSSTSSSSSSNIQSSSGVSSSSGTPVVVTGGSN